MIGHMTNLPFKKHMSSKKNINFEMLAGLFAESKIIKCHWETESLRELFDLSCSKGFKTLTIQRDFKDCLISRYFLIKKNINNTKDWDRIFLSSRTGNSDIQNLNELCHHPAMFDWFQEWKHYQVSIDDPRFKRVRYEDFKNDLDGELVRVCDFLGIREDRLFETIEMHEIKDPVKRNNRSLRYGVVGDYKNYLSQKNIDKLDSLSLPLTY